MDQNWKLQINLERNNATYKPLEIVTGSISFVNVQKNIDAQQGKIKLSINGQLTSQNQDKNKTFEKLGKIQPHQLFSYNQEIQTNSHISPNENYPFSFKIEPNENIVLLESYQGLFIQVEYTINAQFTYSNLSGNKSAHAMKLFFVQINDQGKERITEEKLPIPHPLETKIENTNITGNNIKQTNIPKIDIKISLSSNTCLVNDAIEGEYILNECGAEIKLINLQLIRVEKIASFKEASEILVCQIAEGDIMRKTQLPIYMLLPRSFVCPSFSFQEFNVDFEVSFEIILVNGFKISQNIPLYFYR